MKKIAILISIITSVSLISNTYAEEYLSETTSGTEEYVVEGEVSSDNVAACRAAENQFREFVVGNIDSSITAFNSSFTCITGGVVPPSEANCNELNQSNLEMLQEYRSGLAQVFQELQQHYIENHQMPEFARGCMLHSSAQGNIRGPTTLAMEMPECQPIAAGYFANLDMRVNDLLTGEIPSQIPQEQRDRLKAYQQSPIAQALPDHSKYTRNLSDADLRQALGSSFNDIRSRVQRFRGRISEFSDAELNRLYQFEGQFERFVSYQSEENQQAFNECRQNSRFYNTCRPGAEGADIARCGSQAWGLASEFIPFIPVIDGFAGLGDIRAARDAGIMTSEESVAAQTDNIMKVMFGIGGLTSVARAGARRLATAATRRPINLDMRNLSPAERNRILARNGALSPTQRVEEAGRVLGRNVSWFQQEAIREAHEVGLRRGAGYGSYTQSELREKVSILRNAGFSNQEIDQLMRRGITGNPSLYGSVSFSAEGAVNLTANSTWRQVDDAFTHPESRMTLETFASRMTQVVNNRLGWTAPTPGGFRARALTDRATPYFTSDIRNANEAQEAANALVQGIERFRFTHPTTGRTMWSWSGSGGAQARTGELARWERDQYVDAIRILRERFPGINTPDMSDLIGY